jgi:hypothetical protein
MRQSANQTGKKIRRWHGEAHFYEILTKVCQYILKRSINID